MFLLVLFLLGFVVSAVAISYAVAAAHRRTSLAIGPIDRAPIARNAIVLMTIERTNIAPICSCADTRGSQQLADSLCRH